MNRDFYRSKFAAQQGYGGALYDVAALLRVKGVAEVLRSRKGGLCYLEVGVGTGRFLAEFLACTQRSGVHYDKVVAADLENSLSPTSSAIVTEFHSICLGTEPLPFASESFDIVVCNHVLEHIFETEKALRELNRVARNLCVISVPNIANRWSKLTFLFGELPLGLESGTECATDGRSAFLKRRFRSFTSSGHIRGFTPRTLRDICERCGFVFGGWWNQNVSFRDKLLWRDMGIVLRKQNPFTTEGR